MAKKNLTKEIALALKEGLNFEEFLKKEKITEKDVNYIVKPFYEKAYPVFKEIIRSFEQGISLTKLSKEYKISPDTIMKYLETLGYERPLANPELKWFEDNKQLIIDLYNEHKSLTKVAAIIKADRNKLVKKLKALGVEIDYSSNNLKTYDESFFEKIDTEAKAYWLGFIYADGWVVKNHSKDKQERQLKKYSLGVELSTKDKDHLIKFAKTICLNFGESMLYSRERKIYYEHLKEERAYEMCAFQVASKKIVEDLIKLGCVPNKTLIKTFPTYNEVPSELMGHFMRGYLDGNGTVFEEKKAWVVSTGSQEFAKGFLKELNLQANLKLTYIRKIKDVNCWTFTLGSGKTAVKVFDLMYNKKTTVYLERKYLKFIK